MSDLLPVLLRELEQFGRENDARAGRRDRKMLNITPETGELLALLVRALEARRVLEVGTSNGYSTLWLAEAARAVGGEVVTVEVCPDKAAMARHNLERSGLAPWVRQEVTDAGPFLQRLAPARFELVFLDANRGQYTAWWPRVQEILVPGGLLVVDNAVSHAAELGEFRARVSATAGWRALVVAVGNGELIALKSREEAAPLSRAHLRVARPTDNLAAVVTFYRDGLGFAVLHEFRDHDGFDGVMLGHPGAPYHLEFTHRHGHQFGRAPTEDNLLVFYLPNPGEWERAVRRLESSGGSAVPSFNPYWDRHGRTFADPDGYRVVLYNGRWPT
jgi:predicted O-methyltransferase YrrM/catechol 2,3-dioxygenase-like lactoylglutathione lyase family enzyme